MGIRGITDTSAIGAVGHRAGGPPWQRGACFCLQSLRRQRLLSRQHGASLVEFIVIFPLFLLILLLIIQTCLLFTGRSTVEYAAFSAARAASLWIPQDLSAIGGEGPGALLLSDRSTKYQALLDTAVRICAPICPRWKSAGSVSCLEGDGSVRRPGLPPDLDCDRMAYARAATRIMLELIDRQGVRRSLQEGEVARLDGDETIIVTVVHRFHLLVPIGFWQLKSGSWTSELEPPGAATYASRFRTFTMTGQSGLRVPDLRKALRPARDVTKGGA